MSVRRRPLSLPLPASVEEAIREDFARGESVKALMKKHDATIVAVLHAIAFLRRPS